MSKPDEKDVLAQLTDAEGKIKALEADKVSAAQAVETLKQQHTEAIKAKDAEIATLKTGAEASDKSIKTLEAENKTLKEADHNFELKVAQKLAVLGITQENESKDSTKPMSREEAFEQYGKLTDSRARGEFFATHKQLFI